MMKKTVALIALFAATAGYSLAYNATLDSLDTGVNHYYRPSTISSHDWTDDHVTFGLSVVDDGWGGTSWAGLTYSDVNNPSTGGYDNQFAVYGDGKDHSDNGVYGIGFMDSYNGINPVISFDYAQTVLGFYANNTAYAALDMLNGSGFSKQFTTNDWFKLSIEGFNGTGTSQGVVDFFLADFNGYTDGNNREDYLITDWTFVDLSGLGSDVRSLEFSLSSSDNGMFGMNTPAYFALDDLQSVPEPASVLLILLGGLTVAGCRSASRYFRT